MARPNIIDTQVIAFFFVLACSVAPAQAHTGEHAIAGGNWFFHLATQTDHLIALVVIVVLLATLNGSMRRMRLTLTRLASDLSRVYREIK